MHAWVWFTATGKVAIVKSWHFNLTGNFFGAKRDKVSEKPACYKCCTYKVILVIQYNIVVILNAQKIQNCT